MREEMSADFQVAFIGIAVLIILIFVISVIYLGKQIYYNEYRFKALNHKLDRIMKAVGALTEEEERMKDYQENLAKRDEAERERKEWEEENDS